MSKAVWIETPDNTDVGSKDLPYIGCTVLWEVLPRTTVERGQDDNGNCTQMYDPACVQAIIEAAKQATLLHAGTSTAAGEVCQDLNSLAPAACQKYKNKDAKGLGNAAYPNRQSLTCASDLRIIAGVRCIRAKLIVPNLTCLVVSFGNITYSNGTDSDGCNRQGAKNANTRIASSSPSVPDVLTRDNQTAYDWLLTGVTPVLTAVWSKGNATENPFARGWSDARLTCMRTGQIKEGSAQPRGVPGVAGRTVADGLGMSARLVVPVVVVMAALLF
ncbi:MAG: hypothetical protein LQ346_008734 [Caloplaca aetnensis]|nr:MAG: hypothetical protein LQ346_008734 [Caloplaca aetnensis]